MTVSYLVRHAQTDWNFENRLQGRSDLPLNAVGRQQAARVGRYFSGRAIEAVYTSQLARSRQTASEIARQAGLAPTVDEGLAEIHLGVWEGLTPEEINSRFAGAYDRWKTAPSQVVIPSAEPLPVFRARACSAARRIFARHPSGHVVIVTHGGLISSLLADWLHADYDRLLRRLSLDNGGVSAVVYEPPPEASQPKERGQPMGWWPHILWINDTTHLTNGQGPAV